jgi:pimeloyl-ACP methyl ester carboxylesterase
MVGACMNSCGKGALLIRDHLVKGLFVRETAPQGREARRHPLLMVHGGSHGWWAFEPWLEFFAGLGWRSYSISLRNHADSYSVDPSEYLRLTVQDYADDVLAAMDFINGIPVLIGHSMGGIVVQKVADTKDLAAMVLVSPVGPGQLGPMRDPLPSDKPVMLEPREVRDLWFHNIDQERLNALYRRLAPESPSVINEYSGGSVTIQREAIDGPILVVSGEFDRTAVHPGTAVAGFYKADYMSAAGCGHDIMLEPAGTAVAEDIDLWLSGMLTEPQ